jgi:hypothetical protein
MENNEILQQYANSGIAHRIRRIFAYHYDQIQREIKSEVQNLDPQTRSYFIDLTTEFMEESMNWPDPDNQEEFNEQLTNGFQTFLP